MLNKAGNAHIRSVAVLATSLVLAVSSSAATAEPTAAPSGAAVVPFAFEMPNGTGSADLVDTSRYVKPGPYRIGFSNGWSGNTWRAQMLASLQKEAAKHPDLIKELIVVDGQGDVTKQIADVESLIAQKVDAIMVIANSGAALAPALAKAYDAGIVVMPFNLPLEGDAWTAYVATDACDKGARMAEWLKGAMGATGNYVSLGGLPGNSYTAVWMKCANEALAGTDMQELVYKDVSWSVDTAKVVMTDLLTAYPQIDGLLTDGGPNLLGAYQAMLAAGRELVPGTSDDLNGVMKLYEEQRAANPRLAVGMLSEPTWESRVALQWILGILTGAELPRQYTIEMQLITQDAFPDWIKPDLPDSIQVDTDLTDEELNSLNVPG